MKEWRINLTYKLILFTIFLITPFILFVILNGINLIVQRFIVIYTLEILIFLLSYIVYEVRVRSFYNRLVKKINMLNDKYDIKNSKFSKFLGLDSFSSFEYFFNEELDKVFAELDYYKSGYFKNEEKKGTEIESNKIELDNKIKELEEIKKVEELERELLRRGNEFIKQFKKEVYADNTFFEELAFYLDKSFEIERLIVGQKMVEGYKVYNKLSDEIDESISYEMLGELDKGSYVSHRINEFFRYDVIIIIKIEEKNIGFLMFNVENKEYLNYKKVRDVIEKLFGVLLLIVDFHFKQKIKDEKIEKLSLDVKKLNSQLKETDANLDVHLEQMSNMYEEIVTLYEVGKKLGKIYEKQNIEKTILTTLLEITNTDFAISYEYTNNGISINKFENLKDENLIYAIREEGITQNLFFQMKKVGKPIIVNDITKYSTYNQLTSIVKDNIRNFVEAPIFVNEEIKGGVILFNKDDEFTAANINLITSLINQMSIAVQNIDYFKNEIDRQKEEEQLKIAATIQSGLFPQEMPKLDKVEVYGYNEPARAIGGDYYDLIKLSDNTLIGFIADVSGKGIPAALLVSMVKTIFRMVVEELEENSPEKILERVNTVLLKENLEGRFITAICFRYFGTENKIEMSSAGHDPLIVYKAQEKRFDTYGSESLVLGIMEEEYVKTEIDFMKDDIAIFYTDGVVEARREDGEFYGRERFLETLENNIVNSAEEIGKAIYSNLKIFTENAKQNDDITILIAKGV